MYINHTIQQNDIKNKIQEDSQQTEIQQKQGFQQPSSTILQTTGQSKRQDCFYSKNVMSFNDFQKHIQKLNYENTTPNTLSYSQFGQQKEKQHFNAYNNVDQNQNSYLNIQPCQKQQGEDLNNINQNKPINNQQYHLQQRNGKPPQIQFNPGSQSYEYQSRKKMQFSMNNNSNNNINSTQSKGSLKNQTINEINSEFNKQQNTGNKGIIVLNSSSANTLNKQTNNGFQNFQQLTNLGQQNLQQTQNNQYITNRQLFKNQQTTQNSSSIQQNNLGDRQIIQQQNDDFNFKQEEQQNTSIQQNKCQSLSNQSQSYQSTPRDKVQSPPQNLRLSQIDFGSHSQSQLSKNKVMFYQSKNTQFIKNKQQLSFQQILQQNPIQQQPNKPQLKEQNFLPSTSEFTFQIETPKYEGFSQFLQNNVKSNENLNNKIKSKIPNINSSSSRNVTSPEFSNKYKISNQNFMETPQCNFSSLLTNKESSLQKQLPKANLNQQLIMEGNLYDEEYEYSSNREYKPLTFYNDQSKMTPSYQDRKMKFNENELSDKQTSQQINDEITPVNKRKQKKNRCKSNLDERANISSHQFNNQNKYNQMNNNQQTNNGTENSLSVGEHLDDSILDEKISRSMFKANPSQHIQQKVQYESITIKCIHCQSEQSLQLKKILDTLKSQNINSQLVASYFFHDNTLKQEVSEFQIASNEQKKQNTTSFSSQTLSFQNTQTPYSNQDCDKVNKQLQDLREQLESSQNNFSKNISDSNKAIQQMNCKSNINNIDMRKKSLDVQRTVCSTFNQNLNNVKYALMKNSDDTFSEPLEQSSQFNEQLKSEIKSLKDIINTKNNELDFQQQKMDDMNTQIKCLTVKLQDIEQKYSIDQQIISNLEYENNKMITNLTNTLLIKLKLS